MVKGLIDFITNLYNVTINWIQEFINYWIYSSFISKTFRKII